MSEYNKNLKLADNTKASPVKKGHSETEKVLPKEYGGRKEGLEPTRYGDWEKNGRCIDF